MPYNRFGNLKFERGWWGEGGTSGIPEILLAEVEEAVDQQICEQIRRIPVQAAKTAADLSYNQLREDFCARDFQYCPIIRQYG